MFFSSPPSGTDVAFGVPQACFGTAPLSVIYLSAGWNDTSTWNGVSFIWRWFPNLFFFWFFLMLFAVVSRIQACLSDISSSMSLNKLKLNGDKTELFIIGSKFRPTLQIPPGALHDDSVIQFHLSMLGTLLSRLTVYWTLSGILLIFASLVISIFVIFIVPGNFYLMSIRRF